MTAALFAALLVTFPAENQKLPATARTYVIGAAETLHHIPGLEAVNAFGFDHIALQLSLLLCGALLFAGMTRLSCRKACANFEKLDL